MKKQAPRVTIGLPVYNGADHLESAIDSIRAQTFEDWELVICDNGSTDATSEICADHAARDPRIVYVRGEVNRGASWNYNATFWLARGELFKWQAHDDTCAPTMVERCVQELDADPGVVLAYTWTRFIGSEGEELRTVDDVLDVSSDRPSERLASITRNLRDCNSVFGVIRHEVLAETRLILPFYPSDVALLYELSILGRFAMVPEYLFNRRKHTETSLEANLSRRERMRWYDTGVSKGDRLLAFRLFRTHLAGIRRADLTPAEKRQALEVLATVWPVEHARQTKRRIQRDAEYRRAERRGDAGQIRWR